MFVNEYVNYGMIAHICFWTDGGINMHTLIHKDVAWEIKKGEERECSCLGTNHVPSLI